MTRDRLESELEAALDTLEDLSSQKETERQSKEKELKRPRLDEEQYSSVLFDPERQERLENDIRVFEEEIQMDFDTRRKRCSSLQKEKEDENKSLKSVQQEYERINDGIKSLADISSHGNAGFPPPEDAKIEYDKLAADIKIIKKTNQGQIKLLDNTYASLKNDYKGKNSNLANIFHGLDTLKESTSDRFDSYYYFYERVEQQNEILGDLIRVLETQLQNLERNKNNMVQQSYLHAVQVYEEIHKITEDSSIKLSGKSRPVQMLKIEMLPLEEKAAGIDKVKMYIESCISKIRDQVKQDKKREDIRKDIVKLMSSRELLDKVSDLSKLSIKSYKIEINISNSQYKTWEQVMKENSGGERFVSFFSVLVALMSYTRKSGMEYERLKPGSDTKVLIMDNRYILYRKISTQKFLLQRVTTNC